MTTRRSTVRRALEVVEHETVAWAPRLWLVQGVTRLLPPFVGGRLRARLLRLTGVRVGARSVIGGRVWVGGGRGPAARLTIGADCFVNDGCRFDTSAPVVLEDDVYLGHDVAIVTSSHHVGPPERRAYGTLDVPVTIGRGSWIGSRAVILPGADIGPGTIVGAGSIVTRPVEANTMAAGVPARVIRRLGVEPEIRGAESRADA